VSLSHSNPKTRTNCVLCALSDFRDFCGLSVLEQLPSYVKTAGPMEGQIIRIWDILTPFVTSNSMIGPFADDFHDGNLTSRSARAENIRINDRFLAKLILRQQMSRSRIKPMS